MIRSSVEGAKYVVISPVAVVLDKSGKMFDGSKPLEVTWQLQIMKTAEGLDPLCSIFLSRDDLVRMAWQIKASLSTEEQARQVAMAAITGYVKQPIGKDQEPPTTS